MLNSRYQIEGKFKPPLKWLMTFLSCSFIFYLPVFYYFVLLCGTHACYVVHLSVRPSMGPSSHASCIWAPTLDLVETYILVGIHPEITDSERLSSRSSSCCWLISHMFAFSHAICHRSYLHYFLQKLWHILVLFLASFPKGRWMPVATAPSAAIARRSPLHREGGAKSTAAPRPRSVPHYRPCAKWARKIKKQTWRNTIHPGTSRW